MVVEEARLMDQIQYFQLLHLLVVVEEQVLQINLLQDKMVVLVVEEEMVLLDLVLVLVMYLL